MMDVMTFLLWLMFMFHKTTARFLAEAVHAYKERLAELEPTPTQENE